MSLYYISLIGTVPILPSSFLTGHYRQICKQTKNVDGNIYNTINRQDSSSSLNTKDLKLNHKYKPVLIVSSCLAM